MLGVTDPARQAKVGMLIACTKRAKMASRSGRLRPEWSPSECVIQGAKLCEHRHATGQVGPDVTDIVRKRSSTREVPANMDTRSGKSRPTSSECILPGAKLCEYRHAIGQISAGVADRRGANRRIGSTQERIGLALLADGRRKRRLTTVALSLLAHQTRAQRCALRLDSEREAKVRHRVLVSAIDARAGRQRGELVER